MRVRIAFVNQDRGIDPGRAKGAAVHLLALRSALRARGADVVAFDEHDDVALEAALAEASEHAPFDLVYERYALGKTTASAFAERQRVPFALEVNAPLLEESSRWRGYEAAPEDARAEELLFSRAARVFAVSTPIADYVRRRGARDVAICPNGVDADVFVPAQLSELRAELAPAGRTVIGFHGRLRPWHGLELLGEAAQMLLERGADLQVITLGAGDYEQTLAQFVPRDRHTHLAWVPHDDVARYVGCFDLLPLCYGSEVYFSPLKLAEGMACGAVPVVPPCGDWMRFLRHEHNALVYRAGDAAALGDAIERLATTPLLRDELSRASVATARSMSWTAIADEVLAVARERSETEASL